MRTGSAKQVAVEDLCAKITAGDIEGADNDAEKWTNYRLTKQILNEADHLLKRTATPLMLLPL